jgi:hypothetical protein
MRIFVDTNSGTWGAASGIYIVDGVDDETLDMLDSAPDSEIIEYGKENGVPLP